MMRRLTKAFGIAYLACAVYLLAMGPFPWVTVTFFILNIMLGISGGTHLLSIAVLLHGAYTKCFDCVKADWNIYEIFEISAIAIIAIGAANLAIWEVAIPWAIIFISQFFVTFWTFDLDRITKGQNNV